MHRQLEKIREEYFDLVEKVVYCRGKTDTETIKNLIENFGICDVEINHNSIRDYDNSKIWCVRIESYGEYLDFIYFNKWDKGNQNLDIYFDVYDHDEKCIILDGINILNLKDCYFKYIKNEKAFKLWDEFGDIPIDDNDCILCEWLEFEKGTNRFEIWKWFEENFNVSIADDLLYR